MVGPQSVPTSKFRYCHKCDRYLHINLFAARSRDPLCSKHKYERKRTWRSKGNHKVLERIWNQVYADRVTFNQEKIHLSHDVIHGMIHPFNNAESMNDIAIIPCDLDRPVTSTNARVVSKKERRLCIKEFKKRNEPDLVELY